MFHSPAVRLAAVFMLTAVPASAELVRHMIDYEHQGTPLRGYLVYDDAKVSNDAPAPGILVVHEWWGLNDYTKSRADQLAGLGYVAFAADMFGLDDEGHAKITTKGAQAQAWADTMYTDIPAWRARAQAALAVLAAQPAVDSQHLGAIGFCFGGSTVQQLAYSGADVQAVVSFHGSAIAPSKEDAQQTKAAVLIAHGAADPFAPLDDVRAMLDALEQSDIDYQVNLYGHALHSFTNPASDGSFHPGAKHNPTAEPRAWSAMKRWFREAFAKEADA